MKLILIIIGIVLSRTVGYSGENNSVTPSIRTTNSGRRVQSFDKASFRVIKEAFFLDSNV